MFSRWFEFLAAECCTCVHLSVCCKNVCRCHAHSRPFAARTRCCVAPHAHVRCSLHGHATYRTHAHPFAASACCCVTLTHLRSLQELVAVSHSRTPVRCKTLYRNHACPLTAKARHLVVLSRLFAADRCHTHTRSFATRRCYVALTHVRSLRAAVVYSHTSVRSILLSHSTRLFATRRGVPHSHTSLQSAAVSRYLTPVHDMVIAALRSPVHPLQRRTLACLFAAVLHSRTSARWMVIVGLCSHVRRKYLCSLESRMGIRAAARVATPRKH
jgi:hypothetical protein